MRTGAKGGAGVVDGFFKRCETLVVGEPMVQDCYDAQLGEGTQDVLGRQVGEALVELHCHLSAVVVQIGLLEAHAESDTV